MSDYWKNFWNTSPTIKNDSYFGRVGKTENGKPIEENRWKRMVEFVINQLDINSNSIVLDLCCGNGAYTVPISLLVNKVLAVDISKSLLKELEEFKIKNIELQLSDVNEISLKERFSHVVFMTAIQNFSEKEALLVFEKIFDTLMDGGIFYIGNIPDRLKLWDFVSTKYYENLYFQNLKNETPAVGTWFLQKDLIKMAEYAGFSKIEVVILPEWMHDAKCRFDLKLIK